MFQSNEGFVNALRVSPEGQKIDLAVAKETLAKRQRLAAELAVIDARDLKEWPASVKAQEDAIAACHEVRQALRMAETAVRAATHERLRINSEYTRRRPSSKPNSPNRPRL